MVDVTAVNLNRTGSAITLNVTDANVPAKRPWLPDWVRTQRSAGRAGRKRLEAQGAGVCHADAPQRVWRPRRCRAAWTQGKGGSWEKQGRFESRGGGAWQP